MVCSAQSRTRPHVDEGLCVECYAACYGALGLADIPPEWAEEGTTMTATTTAFVCAGWFDASGEHHQCQTPHPRPQAKGRCARCYQREYSANGGTVGPASRAHLAIVSDAPACPGWTDATGGHHACRGNDGPPVEGGRCARCARLERGADTARRAMAREDDRPVLAPTIADALPPETVAALGGIAEPEPEAPVETAPEPAPVPAAPLAPVLRSQHVRPITAYALCCPNCGETLAMGGWDHLAGRAGETLACGECGAAWRVGAATFAQTITETAARAS